MVVYNGLEGRPQGQRGVPRAVVLTLRRRLSRRVGRTDSLTGMLPLSLELGFRVPQRKHGKRE